MVSSLWMRINNFSNKGLGFFVSMELHNYKLHTCRCLLEFLLLICQKILTQLHENCKEKRLPSNQRTCCELVATAHPGRVSGAFLRRLGMERKNLVGCQLGIYEPWIMHFSYNSGISCKCTNPDFKDMPASESLQSGGDCASSHGCCCFPHRPWYDMIWYDMIRYDMNPDMIALALVLPGVTMVVFSSVVLSSLIYGIPELSHNVIINPLPVC